MPLLRGTRPLKRWRWVGVFSEEIMLCAATVQIAVARQSFWALWLRGRELRDHTRMLPRSSELRLGAGVMRIEDLGVSLAVELDEEDGIVARCPHGRHEAWTRKQAGVPARVRLSVDGAPVHVGDARAVIDDSAGHHARETEWRWSAGVGIGEDGEALAWNLVSGINDPPSGSERAVWIDGRAREAPPVVFAPALDGITCVDGSRLSFEAEARRSRTDNLLIVRSQYTAPFGTFSGTLPGGVRLASGLGVMEHHRARW